MFLEYFAEQVLRSYLSYPSWGSSCGVGTALLSNLAKVMKCLDLGSASCQALSQFGLLLVWLTGWASFCQSVKSCTGVPPAAAHGDQLTSQREQPWEGSACFGGTWQVSAEFTVFATRWKLWFLNVSFFPFFQIQRGAITLFYFTLTSSVLLSAKYFEQSFRCVTTQRCWHLVKAFNFLGRKTWNFNFINVF